MEIGSYDRGDLMEKYCMHLRSFVDEAVRARRAHVSCQLRALPPASRSELEEHIYLCAICAGEVVVLMNRLVPP